MIDLKLDDCPFCGPAGSPEMRVDDDEWEAARVGCDTCNALGPYVELSDFPNVNAAKAEAAKMWNERLYIRTSA